MNDWNIIFRKAKQPLPLYLAVFALTVADVTISWLCISMGYTEANPLANLLIQEIGLSLAMIVGLAYTGGLLILSWLAKWWWIPIMLAIVLAIKVIVVTSNINMFLGGL